MTRDEIAKLEACRETDALVAEKVMGWKVDDLTAYSPSGSSNARIPHGDWWLERYSTDIQAAWSVVLHFMNKGWCPNLVNDDNGHWALSFLGVNNIPCTSQTSWIDYPELWCDEAPLAICRAALLAEEVE